MKSFINKDYSLCGSNLKCNKGRRCVFKVEQLTAEQLLHLVKMTRDFTLLFYKVHFCSSINTIYTCVIHFWFMGFKWFQLGLNCQKTYIF